MLLLRLLRLLRLLGLVPPFLLLHPLRVKCFALAHWWDLVGGRATLHRRWWRAFACETLVALCDGCQPLHFIDKFLIKCFCSCRSFVIGMSAISAKQPCLLRRAPGRSSAGAAPGPPLALHQPLLLPPTLLWLLLALLLTLLLALLLRLRQQWRGWPLGEPACTCRRCCVKPLAERRWQSTHGRQGSQKNGRSGAGPGTPAGEAGTGTAPAPCGRLPRTVRNSPCRLDGQSLAGRAGARWHSQTLDLVHQPGWKREGDP